MNIYIDRGGWAISYLPKQPLTSLLLGAASGRDVPEEQDETALIHEGKYFILHGDWREAYAKCETFEQAYEVFEQKIEHLSPWSN